MNTKTLTISNGLVLALVYSFLASCLLNFHTASACGPGRAGGRRRLMRRYPPLVVRQYIPNVSENTLGASGRHEGAIKRTDKRFKELVMNWNPDIEFRDEERTGADRIMSQRLKEKLSTLAISVMNHWPNVKLRVIEGWDEDSKHTINSLHYEGRAVDITTSDKDKSKYGMLARLAVEAGFDWVHYETRSHVHCSVKSEKADTIRNNGCFHAEALVMTPEGEMEMSQLQTNDLVLSMSQKTGQLVYSPVIMWLDRDVQGQELFVELRTKSNQLIRLTSSHLIYVADELPSNDLMVSSNSNHYADEQSLTGNSNGNNTSKDNYNVYQIGESDSPSGDIYVPTTNNDPTIVEPPSANMVAYAESTLSKLTIDDLTYTTYARNAIVGQYLLISQPIDEANSQMGQVSPSNSKDISHWQSQPLTPKPYQGRLSFEAQTRQRSSIDVHELNTEPRNKLKLDQIVSVNYVTKRGIYAPLTREGNIVVNSVVASCYAVIKDHDIAHLSMAPMRWLSYLKEWTVGIEPESPMAHRTTSYLKESNNQLSSAHRVNHGNDTQERRDLSNGYSEARRSVYSPLRVIHWYPNMLYSIGRYVLPNGYMF